MTKLELKRPDKQIQEVLYLVGFYYDGFLIKTGFFKLKNGPIFYLGRFFLKKNDTLCTRA